MPSTGIVFDTLFAYHNSAALKTAIDLEVLTRIDDELYDRVFKLGDGARLLATRV